MNIGYARVSTKDQSLDLQVDALRRAGCDKVYQEVVSGAKAERPVLDALLADLRPGDVLVIWKLDRLGRSLRHLVELASALLEKGVGLKSLNDPIDTTTSSGRLTFNLFASLAEFERDLIRERTQAGLTAARARGRLGGRPKGLAPQAETTARPIHSRSYPLIQSPTLPTKACKISGENSPKLSASASPPCPRAPSMKK